MNGERRHPRCSCLTNNDVLNLAYANVFLQGSPATILPQIVEEVFGNHN